MTTKRCYYVILGIARTATAEEVKRAFRAAAMRLHPDKGGDPEAFKEAVEAYEVLSDADRRSDYDHGDLNMNKPKYDPWEGVNFGEFLVELVRALRD